MKQQFLVTIMHYDGQVIETYIHEDDKDMDSDSVFWNLRLILPPEQDLKVQYINSIPRKSPKLIAVKQIG